MKVIENEMPVDVKRSSHLILLCTAIVEIKAFPPDIC